MRVSNKFYQLILSKSAASADARRVCDSWLSCI